MNGNRSPAEPMVTTTKWMGGSILASVDERETLRETAAARV